MSPLLDHIKKEEKKERIVGIHPEYGVDVIASMGYYGPMVSYDKVGKGMKDDMVRAKIVKPYTIDSITLDDALKILRYPRILGKHPETGKNVELKKGKFGKYVEHDNNRVSFPEENSDSVDLDRALELIEEKEFNNKTRIDGYLFYAKEKNIEYIVNNGKNSKYLMIRDVTKKNTKPLFVNFPDTESLENMTLDRAKEMANEGKKSNTQKNKTSNKNNTNNKNSASNKK